MKHNKNAEQVAVANPLGALPVKFSHNYNLKIFVHHRSLPWVSYARTFSQEMEARNPERISRSLRAIEEVWSKFPHLRLGQLLLNAMENPEDAGELYYMEDDKLLKRLGVRNPPATQPIANPPVIDLRKATEDCDVHAAFADALCFPDFYGMNWDAFWDVLTGFGCFPPNIIIAGRAELAASSPGTLETLEKIFKDYEEEGDVPSLTIEWR